MPLPGNFQGDNFASLGVRYTSNSVFLGTDQQRLIIQLPILLQVFHIKLVYNRCHPQFQ
jgi:hypothetical protein